MISFDANLLTSYYQSRAGVTGGGLVSGGSNPPKAKLPTPPWDARADVPRADELTRRALLGGKLVNPNTAQLDVPGASEDYRKLFSLYQGLNTLYGLAERAGSKGVTSGELSRIQDIFSRGLGEVMTYTDNLKLDQVRLARGAVTDRLRTETGVRRDKAEYVTGVIHSGSSSGEVAAFQGAVKFDIAVKRGPADFNISIDLADMGAQPRTMANVVNFINGKFSAAGLQTRFATERLPNEPRTIQVNGKPVTLPATADRWAWKIKGDTSEVLTFSTPAVAGAVYLAQSAGKTPAVGTAAKPAEPDLTERQLLKFQTDNAAVAAPAQEAGEAFWVDGRVNAVTLGKEVAAIRATASGPDGSVYMLAEVDDTTGGQTIQGERDVALLKYDSAGKLVFTRTLGAADEASGFALAVAADGKVAIAGSVTGRIEGATEGPMNSADDSGKSDSFVTLFNADGEEIWTQRRGAREDDEAKAVAFGADGTVYVAGRTKSVMPGATAVGGWDGYLTAYATQSTGAPKALFTQQFGTAGEDKVGGLAIDGNRIVVAGVESGAAVVRGFTVSLTTVTTTKTTVGGDMTTTIVTAVDGTPTNTQSSTVTTGGPDGTSSKTFTTGAAATADVVRSLGDLQGGDVAGVAISGGEVILAGSTRNGALSAGTATTTHAGGSDAFVARLSSALTAQGSDRIGYFGGDSDDGATAMTVSGGQVWIAGSTSSTTMAGAAKIGTKDGYLARVDVGTGTVGWSRRFTGRDGVVAPTSIAVDAAGASVLDQLGLPKGTIDYKDSQLLTAATSVRAGDQFFIRSKEGGRPVAVTIAANDTLATLATKVKRAAGFSAKVEVVKDGNYSRLQIKPLNERTTVEVIAGKGGADALAALGLKEGVARPLDAEDAKKVYGLGLSNDLDLSDKASITLALDQLSKSLSKIRTVYRDLDIASKSTGNANAPAAAASGPVPAYLQAQLANYQAGLSKLGGG